MEKIFLILLVYFSIFTFDLQSQWIVQQIPVNKPITGLEFVNSMEGWACTNGGNQHDTAYILNTTNGGVLWNIQHFFLNHSLNSLDMIDDSVGYITGSDFGPALPVVYKTINGGTNWFVSTLGTGTYLDDVFFVNRDSGYVSGSLFVNLFTTTNGGINWIERQSGILYPPTRLYFLDYNTGWCGAGDVLYKTTNAGMNWVQISTFAQLIYAIQFKNENTGWLGLSEGWVAYTTNSGQNWVFQKTYQFANIIRDLQYLTDSLGWAGSGFPEVFKTTNNGANWIVQENPSSSYRISFVDSLLGWTGRSKIAHTTNGGITFISFNTQIIPESYALYQNYPNPFNPETTIKFSLPSSSYVQIKIYDILGKETAVWKSNELLPAGEHELRYNAGGLSSGVYFYKFSVTGKKGNILYSDTKKMILVR